MVKHSSFMNTIGYNFFCWQYPRSISASMKTRTEFRSSRVPPRSLWRAPTKSLKSSKKAKRIVMWQLPVSLIPSLSNKIPSSLFLTFRKILIKNWGNSASLRHMPFPWWKKLELQLRENSCHEFWMPELSYPWHVANDFGSRYAASAAAVIEKYFPVFLAFSRHKSYKQIHRAYSDYLTFLSG